MGDDRILNLVESAIEAGASAADVCSECPELIPEVERRLREYRLLEARLEAILPDASASAPATASTSAPLPDIPGYEIRAVLGRGGMGVVFLGRHLKLRRDVAIKMLLSGAYAGAAERERFTREARSLATLRHPNIVSVHDVGESDGCPYFTMEHMDGGALADTLGGRPKPFDEAVRLALTLADAIGHAHRYGIVHRDLKPGNVLLDATGTPKISDFGIAITGQGDLSLTLPGARLGTPSYMAPEQIPGRSDEIGPTTDIYALGAILYELLTGRPPFRSSTSSETERQLLHEEPAPPRMLNAGIPRDVETICLKCLQKLPSRRYQSAADLATDLRSFLAGKPIVARPIGLPERTLKWIRRRPGPAAAIATGVVLLMTLTGAILWTASARATAAAAVVSDLHEAATHQRAGEWQQSRAAIERAKVRIGHNRFADLRRELQRVETNLQLVEQLDAARLLNTSTQQGVVREVAAAETYARLFSSNGIGAVGDLPEVVAERIRSSPISRVLISSLDDWAMCTKRDEERRWIIQVTNLSDVDDDPGNWRRRVRVMNTNAETIAELARETPFQHQPATFLYAYARVMNKYGVDCRPFLEHAMRVHPSDFWLISLYGTISRLHRNDAAAVEYFRAALALRPDTMVSHYNLGRALGALGRYHDAEIAFLEAIRLDPEAPDPIKALGLALSKQDRHLEAIDTFLAAYAKDADDPSLLALLAQSCLKTGRYDEAVKWHALAIAADPRRAHDFDNFRDQLIEHGRHDLAQSIWKSSLADDASITNWDSYAELCIFNGDEAEYENARAFLLDQFTNIDDPNWCERIARAALLTPPSAAQIAQATALIDRALASQASERTWAYPYFMLAKALAAYRAGDFHTARTIAEGESAPILPPIPKLLAAMANERLGRRDDALRLLAEASISMDCLVTRAQTREAWIAHILRREAQRLITPDLADMLVGGIEPAIETHPAIVLAASQASGSYARWATLWERSNAFGISLDQTPPHAICTLVLAAAGAGADAERSTAADRDRWRRMAFAALTEQLKSWERHAADADPTAVAAARDALLSLCSSPHLVSVRDPRLLQQLAEPHRSEWQALWARFPADQPE